MAAVRQMLNLSECYIFDHPSFRRLMGDAAASSELDRAECFQALQAAFYITQIELREDSAAKRRKCRKERFGTLISVRL